MIIYRRSRACHRHSIQMPETTSEPIESAAVRVGCYIYGCLGVAAFMLLLALCSGVGLYYFVSGQVEKVHFDRGDRVAEQSSTAKSNWPSYTAD